MNDIKAFPSGIQQTGEVWEQNPLHEGMLLRDWLAGKAMQGLISDHDSRISVREYAKQNDHSFAKEVSILSYDLADAMIQQREANK